MAIVGRINQYASLNVSGQFNEVGYSTISVGQSSFVTPGTYSWTVPAGVTSISVVTVGGGGGGALGDSGGAGGGGALAYVNHISVTPGETLTVGVGTSGIGATSSSGIGSIAFNGGNSYLKRSATSLVEAGGGKKGNNILIDGNGLGGAGGTVIVGTGGSGGKGGDYDAADGMGGGGAGGYSGSGGVGASPNVAAGAGSGGGGGGGATSIFPGAGGGGVGINGEGPSGLGGVSSGGGGGGSGGENGEDRPSQTRGGNGGKYGGGGATGDSGADISGFGASGAVRIIWGLGRNRQFPATNTTDLSGTYAKANISGLGTYTALEFTENIGVSTLTLNTYPAYDLFEDEFAGVLYGLGKGTYARQNLNGSVDVYNEINELDLTPTIVFTPSVTSLNENGTIDFSIATTNVEDGVQLYYEIITPTPTATLTQSATSVMSGTSISFDATTVNVGNGTTLSYDIVGIASSSDFADNTLVGIRTVTGGIIDTITKTAAGSGDKTFTLNLRSQGNILASSSVVTITKAQLYDFTSFTFTNATAQGTTGPTLLNLQSAYSAQSWASNTSYLNLYSSTQGYQYWAVPADGTYRITAVGAQGGAVPNSSYGGFGAIMRATIPLIMGDYLIFVVGQRGGYSGSGGSGSGGGGGTFVFKNNLFLPFLIAGGGGGVTNTNTISNALTTNSGANSSNGNIGGTGGNGGNSSSNSGGGGAGLTGNGGLVQSSANVDSGKNITTGSGVGGRGGTCGASSGTNNFNNLGRDQGGFGGGGGGEWCTQGSTGGGGGYSGGAAGNNSASGGGGSYVNPSLATLIGTSNGLYNGTGTYQNLGFNGSFLTADFSNSMGYVTVEKIS
jgi:hypothetical protein